jgi:hypothetical protein
MRVLLRNWDKLGSFLIEFARAANAAKACSRWREPAVKFN